MILPRLAANRIQNLLTVFPVVVVTGPRQSGKSTLLKHLLPGYRYVTFDLQSVRELFEQDRLGFVRALGQRVILDEVQKVPAVFEVIKVLVDENWQSGAFVLTGSAQFPLVKGLESLAGRCGFQSLLPFQVSEIPREQTGVPELTGFYPELVLRGGEMAREWYDGYVTTYLERDVRDLLAVTNLNDFRKVVGLLAARTGQELNLSSIAREAGINERTVNAWVSVLEASYLVFLVRPWHNNLGKRLVKRPKLYFWDTGLVCFLTGIRTMEQLESGPMAGTLFENFVVADLHKTALHGGFDQRFSYFRTNAGVEIDLLVEAFDQQSLTLLEVKRRATPKADDTKSLRAVLSAPGLLPEGWSAQGLVVLTEGAVQPITAQVQAVGAPQLLRETARQGLAFWP
ncbi:MAG: ATP-binding protein [Spirochaetales bacterium]